MAASPAGPQAWSVALRLRHRGGLEIRASAENVLPGWWGRGGERLSLLLRLRRRLILAVTSRCGPSSPVTGTPPPPGNKVIRLLRSGWTRVTPVWRWRRKNNKPSTRGVSGVAPGNRSQKNRSSTQTIHRAWAPAPAAMLWCAAAVLAAAAVFYLKISHRGERGGAPVAHCASWRCFLAQFLEPPPSLRRHEWSLRLLKRSLKWLLLHN